MVPGVLISIVNEDKRIVGIGYNGFPMGCSDDDLPWARQAERELDTKYPVSPPPSAAQTPRARVSTGADISRDEWFLTAHCHTWYV